MKITDKKLQSLAKAGVSQVIADSSVPNLYINVGATSVSFTLKYRIHPHNKQIKKILGRYPTLGLSEARALAEEKKAIAASGDDPFKMVARKSGLFIDEARAYCNKWHPLNEDGSPLSEHHAGTRRYLLNENPKNKRRYIKELWNLPMDLITQGDAMRALENCMEEVGGPTAHKIREKIIAVFTEWHRQDLDTRTNTMLGLPLITTRNKRTHYLTMSECARVTKAVRYLPYPFGPMFEMLFLSASRLGNIRALEWDHCNFDRNYFEIPTSNMKTKKFFVLPMTHQMKTILLKIRDEVFNGERVSKYVFTTTLETPVSGISKAKARLNDLAETTDWVNHDIRRTISNHGKMFLNIPADAIESILAHTEKGVSAHYGTGSPIETLTECLQKWNDYLDDMVKPGVVDGNVVKLQSAK